MSLLKFFKNRHPKFFLTFDRDSLDSVKKTLEALQLEKGKHYIPIGQQSAGKGNIEGLLPECVISTIYGSNVDLVQAATAGTKEQRKNAKSQLKKLLLNEFKKQAEPTQEFYGKFYPLVKVMNKVLG
jgi:hypothetical protein